MLEIGAGGETMVAYVRVSIVAMLFTLPLASLIFSGADYENNAGAVGVFIALLISLYWLKLTKTEPRPNWLPFVTTASDVSSVSLVLLIITLINPSAGSNSVVAWLCYPLCILITALRNDTRVTWFAGLLAFAQYALILAYILSLPEAQQFSHEYGTATLSNAVQRLLLIILFTLSTSLIVYRMQLLVKISGTDNLTGLPNRMYLNQYVPRLIESARKRNTSLTVAIIDLDFFKTVNDEYGHHVGDAALRHVVDVINTELDSDESILRVGGEEFLFVSHHDSASAKARLECLRKLVAASPFKPDHEHSKLITFSAGVANFPLHADTLSDLLKHADSNLRQAKQSGRNQII